MPKDKDAPLSDKESKKALDAAKAAGRSAPSATDVRDAVKSSEADKDQPKNTGAPGPTGNQAKKKQELSDSGGRSSSDASRSGPNNPDPGIKDEPDAGKRAAAGKRAPKTEKNH